ncbi:MAG: hypothetical protein J6125_03570 [Clostridia bacterium]|nr:hypothetical protein [Clostridia bacterium]
MQSNNRSAPARQKARHPAGVDSAPVRLKLLFVIIARGKAEFFSDLLQSFSVNLQMSVGAQGTANTDMLRLLGLSDSDKAVLVAVIREDRAAEALSLLDEKFRTIKGGKGIAYTVPMDSVIGVAIYRFLADLDA